MSGHGEVVRNKERLVCNGYSQQEGIDYEETFSLASKIKVVRIFLAYGTSNKSEVYQMDVKSTFINGELEEKV